MSATDRAVADIRSVLARRQPNDLQRALDNYNDMEADRDRLREAHADLLVANRSLQTEVNLLRETLTQSQKDCRRLQAVASTFGGQARSLSAIFNDIMALAIKHGIEAAQVTAPEETEQLNRDGAEVREIIERIEPAAPAGAVLAPNAFLR